MTTIGPSGTTLGVVGGGQLGRMLAEAAAPLGIDLVVVDPTPKCPASAVARDHVVADFDDPDGVDELAARADYLTYEIELADPDVLERASEDHGVPVHPSPETLRTIQDKLVQKRHLAERGVPVPEFVAVDDADDVAAAIHELESPVMLKARRGGYDGRGNRPVHEDEDFAAALAEVGAGEGGAMAERMVDFERELSVIGAVGDGEWATFPAGENVHEDEILRTTVVPARTSDAVRERAQAVARDVLDALEGRGVYGIELFETADGEILVNEIAPRPHNSGHWTIEGATTSQFEQHTRAVAGLPLGSTHRRCPTVMVNVLGDVAEPTRAELTGVGDVLATPGAHLHWYGKREVRPLRKMGHVTLTPTDGEDAAALLEPGRRLRDGLTFE
ncbi:5-(carboxyamino)imidazole ribonucleotide synthase [Halobacteriales archaeon QS_1_68_20]|nr:MAG: 5-(carboxyamino)imidazole ribonucleotide synthase [Halobacteriales archaeon QS_1_68_20]